MAAPCVWPVRGGSGVAVAKLAVRDVAQLTARYVVGGGDREGRYDRVVVEGWRGRGAGGVRGEDAGLSVAAPTAAAAAPAPAPPAAIRLLLATTLATMDEGTGVAWRLPRGAAGLRGSGGEGGCRCEARGQGRVGLSASRA